MVEGISINMIGGRKTRDNLGRIIDNLPRMLRKSVRKSASKYAGNLRRKVDSKHRFTGEAFSVIKAKPDGKYKWVVTAPDYLKFLETGTRSHWVSMKNHPEVLRWIMQKGVYPPLYQKGNSIKIRTQQYRIFSDTIRESRPQIRQIIKQDWDDYIKSKGRNV